MNQIQTLLWVILERTVEFMPLFRESCQYVPGISEMNIFEGKLPKPFYKKPIDKLNRDLNKLIIIDTDPRAFHDFPDNGLLFPKFEEDKRDLAVYDLTLFLTQLSYKDIDDVRPVIRHYSELD